MVPAAILNSAGSWDPAPVNHPTDPGFAAAGTNRRDQEVRLLLCGDVMTGRGVDQVLPEPSPPVLYEPAIDSALDYVELAERVHGPIPKPVDFPLPEVRTGKARTNRPLTV